MKYGFKAGWRARASSETAQEENVASDVVTSETADDAGQDMPSDEDAVVAETVTDEPCAAEQTEVSPWEAEAAEVGQTYAQFDWETEQNDPRFISMLKAGVPMLDAYRALHMEEILVQWSEQVRAQAEKRITDHVQARGTRPSENGAAGTQGVQLWQNVHRLTRQKRAEIASRAHNGEQISFR